MDAAPERIYLQVGPDCGSEDLDKVTWHGEEVCWCDRQVFDTDIEYVRADLQAARIAELEAVVEQDDLVKFITEKGLAEEYLKRMHEARKAEQ